MGNYPPPIGGISTHIKQLSQKLYENNMLEYVYSYLKDEVPDAPSYVKCALLKNKMILKYGIFSSLICVVKQLIKDKSDIIHFHHAPIWESISFLVLMLCSRKKIVITIHDQFQLLDNYPRILKSGFNLLQKFSKRIKWIAVNENIKKQLEDLNIFSEDIFVIPAYIGSPNNDTLPDEILSFLSGRSLKISFYAYSISLNDHDLYGVAQVVKVSKLLKNIIPDFGLVMCLPNSDIMMHDLINEIKNEDLESNILIVTTPLSSMVPLFKQTDIYLRPTTTDGDSVSIREALDSNCLVIASDAVNRIDSCVIYKLNDTSDLLKKILNVCQRRNRLYKISIVNSQDSSFRSILDVYNSFN